MYLSRVRYIISKIQKPQAMLCSSTLTYYCFNPFCTFVLNRVFPANDLHFESKPCQSWIISSHQIQEESTSYFQTERSSQKLDLKSKPLRTMIKIALAGQQLRNQYVQYFQKLKHQVQQEIQHAQALIINKITDIIINSSEFYQKIKLIHQTSKHVKDSNMISFKIVQFSEQHRNHAQKLQDLILAGLEDFQQIQRTMVQSIKIPISQIIKVKEHRLFQQRFKAENNYLHRIKNEEISQKIENQDEKNQQQKKRQMTAISFLRNNKNFNTLERIMNSSSQRLYKYQNQTMYCNCQFCDFSNEKTLEVDSKALSTKMGLQILINHLIEEHKQKVIYNFEHCISQESVRQINLCEIIEQMKKSKMKKVILVDRSQSLYFKDDYDESEPSMAVQFLFNDERPHSKCQYVKEYSKEDNFLLALGYLLYQVSINLKKKIIVFTSEKKSTIIIDFCQKNHIQNVNIVIGKGKKQTQIKEFMLLENQNRCKKQIGKQMLQLKVKKKIKEEDEDSMNNGFCDDEEQVKMQEKQQVLELKIT